MTVIMTVFVTITVAEGLCIVGCGRLRVLGILEEVDQNGIALALLLSNTECTVQGSAQNAALRSCGSPYTEIQRESIERI